MTKNLNFISSLALAIVLAGCNSASNRNETTGNSDSGKKESDGAAQVFNYDTTKLASGAIYYQCEMDPEIISDKQGNCPTCGMELTEIKKQ